MEICLVLMLYCTVAEKQAVGGMGTAWISPHNTWAQLIQCDAAVHSPVHYILSSNALCEL